MWAHKVVCVVKLKTTVQAKLSGSENRWAERSEWMEERKNDGEVAATSKQLRGEDQEGRKRSSGWEQRKVVMVSCKGKSKEGIVTLMSSVERHRVQIAWKVPGTP